MEDIVRAVLDSNILARAARPSTGPAREVLTRLRTPPHSLIASPFPLQAKGLKRIARSGEWLPALPAGGVPAKP
jgi:hypothetical protein